LADAEPIGAAAGLIRDGAILAIKGLGGFHLACDATNGDAVRRLRQRKRRDRKPFAVMVASVEDAAALAVVGADERAMLEMPAAPIVLLEPRAGGALADGVAPGQSRIGVMLAYTPLHHLLMRALAGPAVMTSGNLSSEPQCTDNDAARRELAGIADAFLLHDREIVHRVDDSLVRADAGSVSMLRRARGYAPQPLPLAADFRGAPPVLALGGELKSTFCFLRDGAATVSQHLGDLEHAETHRAFRSALALYRGMFALEPRIIAIDRHPDYLSSQWGAAIARETGAALVPVQHHHAHLAAVLAEHGVSPDAAPVLGIILDGTGLGDDATIWGGEFLLGGYARYERLAHLEPVRLPGGAAAVREPWRNTLAHLVAATGLGGPELAARSGLDWLRGKPVAAMQTMLDRGINAPLASSAGRAFDAVAGAIGLCRDRQDYEGQAAMELETLALSRIGDVAGYPFRIAAGPPLVLGYGPMWRALLDDLAQGASPEVMAARFHRFLIDGIVETAVRLGERHRFTTIALSGGVFQNRILLLGVRAALEARGLAVLVPRQLPANDGGLSLGQAASAAVRAKFWFEGQNRLSLDAGSQVCRANPEAR
jgi:hydrogenase maturation protein HypF